MTVCEALRLGDAELRSAREKLVQVSHLRHVLFHEHRTERIREPPHDSTEHSHELLLLLPQRIRSPIPDTHRHASVHNRSCCFQTSGMSRSAATMSAAWTYISCCSPASFMTTCRPPFTGRIRTVCFVQPNGTTCPGMLLVMHGSSASFT